MERYKKSKGKIFRYILGRKSKILGWEYEGWDKSWINNFMYEVEEPDQANCTIMIDWSQQQMLSEEHKIQISIFCMCVRVCWLLLLLLFVVVIFFYFAFSY